MSNLSFNDINFDTNSRVGLVNVSLALVGKYLHDNNLLTQLQTAELIQSVFTDVVKVVTGKSKLMLPEQMN